MIGKEVKKEGSGRTEGKEEGRKEDGRKGGGKKGGRMEEGEWKRKERMDGRRKEEVNKGG